MLTVVRLCVEARCCRYLVPNQRGDKGVNMNEQYYVFTLPGDDCPVWAEMFLADGRHVVGPTPFGCVSSAVDGLIRLHPMAVVDELDTPADIGAARRWARVMPLEDIAA